MTMSRRMWLKEQERKKRERARRAKIRQNIALLVVLLATVVVLIITMHGCSSKSETAAPTAQENATAVPNAVQQTTTDSIQPTVNGSDIAAGVNADFFEDAVFVGNALASGVSRYGLLPLTDVYAGVSITLDNVYTTAANNSSMAIIDQLKSKKYTKVFLSFGELELAENDAQSFRDKYETLVADVKSYQSSANIYLIGIPPATQASGVDMTLVRDYNDAIIAIAEAERIYYVDTDYLLSGTDGYLPSGISSDGINLNMTAYAELLGYIETGAKIPSASSTNEYTDDDENTDEESSSSSRRRTSSSDDEDTSSRVSDDTTDDEGATSDRSRAASNDEDVTSDSESTTGRSRSTSNDDSSSSSRSSSSSNSERSSSGSSSSGSSSSSDNERSSSSSSRSNDDEDPEPTVNVLKDTSN